MATLVMDTYLSRLLMQAVPSMQYIADPYGRLAFPVRILGTVEHVQVVPDMEYVIRRVMAVKGQELLLNALRGTL